MKKQRSLPFGYELHRGKVEIHKKEAPLVRKIYRLYEDGKSIAAIATIMNEQSIPYSPSVCQWNKHHVKRILENEKYIGTNGYPKIIEKDAFERIREIHANKTAAWQSPAPMPEKIIWQRLECEECGGRIQRMGGRYKTATVLQCKNCGKLLRVQPEELKQKLLQKLTEHLEPTPPEPYTPSQEIMRMENEIFRQIEKPSNAEGTNKLILQAAAKRYELCKVLQAKPSHADWQTYKEMVDAAILSADNIQLRFKHDRKETSHDSNSKECAGHSRKFHADTDRQA